VLRSLHMRASRLALRMAIVAALLTWAADHFAVTLVRFLLPVIQFATTALGPDFRILGIDVFLDGGVRTLQVRADLAHPLVLAGQVLVPIDWAGTGTGWMEIRLTLGGLLQYPLLQLIAVLGWPAQTSREMLARLASTLPLLVALLALTLPATILAELWYPLHDRLTPGATWPLLAFSRFLMGGGGQALALFLSLLAIGAGASQRDLPFPGRSAHSARTVIEPESSRNTAHAK
jgi:hypothetical protein